MLFLVKQRKVKDIRGYHGPGDTVELDNPADYQWMVKAGIIEPVGELPSVEPIVETGVLPSEYEIPRRVIMKVFKALRVRFLISMTTSEMYSILLKSYEKDPELVLKTLRECGGL